MKITKFMAVVGEEYKVTSMRPYPTELYKLEAEADEKRKTAKKHVPGKGWHYVKSENPIAAWNGKYWWLDWPSSEGAILAEVEAICKLTGVDFTELQRRAYPQETTQTVSDEDRALLTHHISLDDLDAIYDDLEDVNYHSLNAEFQRAMSNLRQVHSH